MPCNLSNYTLIVVLTTQNRQHWRSSGSTSVDGAPPPIHRLANVPLYDHQSYDGL